VIELKGVGRLPKGIYKREGVVKAQKKGAAYGNTFSLAFRKYH
jgi:hypothetical protein